MKPTCLYRHFNKTGALLYVGMANNALSRLQGHRAKASWLDEIARVEIEWFPTRDEAHAAERAAIQSERPIHNNIRYRPKPSQKLANGVRPKTSTYRSTINRRLERAGFVHMSAWVQADDPLVPEFLAEVEAARPEVERIAAEPPRPRGRPRKEGN